MSVINQVPQQILHPCDLLFYVLKQLINTPIQLQKLQPQFLNYPVDLINPLLINSGTEFSKTIYDDIISFYNLFRYIFNEEYLLNTLIYFIHGIPYAVTSQDYRTIKYIVPKRTRSTKQDEQIYFKFRIRYFVVKNTPFYTEILDNPMVQCILNLRIDNSEVHLSKHSVVLNKLYILQLNSCTFKNTVSLERFYLPKLLVLAIYRTSINLKGIRRYNKLQILIIESINLTEEILDEISQLTSLHTLIINNCNIETISFVRNMRNLKIFIFSDNKVTDISPLCNNTQLKILICDNNLLSSLDCPLNELLYLSAYKNLLQNININFFRNLFLMDISYNRHCKIVSNGTKMKNLCKFLGTRTSIQDLNFIASKFLLTLEIDFTMVEELPELKNLRELKIYGTNVSSLQPIKNSKLVKLIGSKCTSIQDVMMFQELKILINSNIMNIFGVEELSSLKKLEKFVSPFILDEVAQKFSHILCMQLKL